MKLEKLARRIFKKITKRDQREPDIIIGGHENPYLYRWYIIPRNRFFNIYLHLFFRSDDDRALHDHPWWSCSFILEGEYNECLSHAWEKERIVRRSCGDVVWRKATSAHRIILIDGVPCWTLFITEPRLRKWGFHCPGGWRHWREFTSEDGKTIGPGCAGLEERK